MSENEFISNAFESLNISEKVNYKNRLKELNLTLSMNQFPELNDLFDLNYKPIISNLKLVTLLIEDRHKILESKNELAQKLSKLEGEQVNKIDKNDALNQKVKDLSSKVQYLQNQLNSIKEKKDKEIDKSVKEKEEALKSLQKISLKEGHYKCEIKKLENSLEEVKTKLKKYMNDNKEIKLSDNKNERILINSNTIIFDNFLKNSPSIILNQVNYTKDFYNLIFKSFNEKLKLINKENKDLKECLKFLKEEFMNYIDFKKKILYMYAQEKFQSDSQIMKNCSNIINKDIFNLNFESSKNEILQLFSDVIDNFRFVLMYDIYKINPESEFNYEEITNTLKNNTYNIENVPYFNNIRSAVEKLNLGGLEDLKKDIESRLNQKDQNTKRKIESMEIPISSELHFAENDILGNLEEVENEINNNMNSIDYQFKNVEEEIMNEIKRLSEEKI